MSRPSNKVIYLGTSCFIILGSIAFYLIYPTIAPKPKVVVAKNQDLQVVKDEEQPTSAVVELDSDGDGLKDWEEELQGTNPQKADTDGDGTNDGDEIKQHRNPLKKGPDDKEVSTSVTANASATTTLTQKIGRDIFTALMTAKEQGKELSQADQAKLVQDALDASAKNTVFAQYSLSDIHVVEDTNDSLTAYGNEIGALLLKNSIHDKDEKGRVINELLIVDAAGTKQDPKELAKIDLIENSYKRIISGLKTMNVPQSAANTHVEVLNAFTMAVTSDEGMKKLFTDAASSFTSLKTYQDASINVHLGLQSMKSILTQAEIEYAPGEPGYVFMTSK